MADGSAARCVAHSYIQLKRLASCLEQDSDETGDPLIGAGPLVVQGQASSEDQTTFGDLRSSVGADTRRILQADPEISVERVLERLSQT